MSNQDDIQTKLEALMREMGMSDADIEKAWTMFQRSKPKPTREERKASILQTVQAFLDSVIKPEYVRPDEANKEYPYTTDITVEWRKQTLYFLKHMYNPWKNEPFQLPYVRMSWIGGDTFNLAYQRHTGKYQIIYRRISLEECLEALATDMLLQP